MISPLAGRPDHHTTLKKRSSSSRTSSRTSSRNSTRKGKSKSKRKRKGHHHIKENIKEICGLPDFDYFICGLCQDVYDAPVALKCGDVFCGDCIREVVEKQEDVSVRYVLTCPACSAEYVDESRRGLEEGFTVPVGLNVALGIMRDLIVQKEGAVRRNRCFNEEECDSNAVHYCENCLLYFCDDCLKVEHSSKIVVNHVVIDSQLRKILPRCSEHNLPTELYCYGCRILVCDKCGIYDHSKHKVASLPDAVSIIKKEILGAKQPLTNFLDTHQEKMKILKKKEQSLLDKLEKIKTSLELLKTDAKNAEETGALIDEIMDYFSPVDLIDNNIKEKIFESIEELVKPYHYWDSSSSYSLDEEESLLKLSSNSMQAMSSEDWKNTKEDYTEEELKRRFLMRSRRGTAAQVENPTTARGSPNESNKDVLRTLSRTKSDRHITNHFSRYSDMEVAHTLEKRKKKRPFKKKSKV
eukprot:TRINITY_DN2672_c0_g2_i1.p1 TRINITY_DN2672_c0_g2~~TRINITY_DN2672_c0_g2_i1.p1  ORF type:complete len:482 (+),score=104.83 TRINITY_DN2672_c0_g2_i1:45-1448(+)